MSFETFGPINSKGVDFLTLLADVFRLALRETAFLFQHLSLTIQRFKAVCFNGSFCFKNADLDS